jgi:hypothetical protein
MSFTRVEQFAFYNRKRRRAFNVGGVHSMLCVGSLVCSSCSTRTRCCCWTIKYVDPCRDYWSTPVQCTSMPCCSFLAMQARVDETSVFCLGLRCISNKPALCSLHRYFNWMRRFHDQIHVHTIAARIVPFVQTDGVGCRFSNCAAVGGKSLGDQEKDNTKNTGRKIRSERQHQRDWRRT